MQFYIQFATSIQTELLNWNLIPRNILSSVLNNVQPWITLLSVFNSSLCSWQKCLLKVTCLALCHIIRCADAIRAVGEGRHMLICAQRLCVSGGAGGGVQYRGKCLWRCDEVEEGSQSSTAAQTPRSSLCIHRHYLHKYFISICAGKIRSFSIVFFWKDCLSAARKGQRWRPVVVYWRQRRAGSDWRGSLWKQSSVVYQHRYQLTFLSNLEGSILISEQRNLVGWDGEGCRDVHLEINVTRILMI